jgi:hypothetical protein
LLNTTFICECFTETISKLYLFDWLIDCLWFYFPLKNFSLTWSHCQWWAAKFRPMLGALGLWAGRDLYHATPAMTQDLSFSPPHPKDCPWWFSHLLRHAWGCGGSILTLILTGSLSSCILIHWKYNIEHISVYIEFKKFIIKSNPPYCVKCFAEIDKSCINLLLFVISGTD